MVCPQARAEARASGCSTSAAAGAASRSGRRPGTAPASSASPSRRRRPRRRASGPRRPGVADRVEIRVMDYRDLRRRALRRDRQHRHGRARRRRARSTSTRAPSPACSSRAAGCSTTASPACATPTPRPGRSPSATSSPTPRRCTSRGSCWRSNGRASSPDHVEEFGADYAETLRHWVQAPRREPRRGASASPAPERVRVWRLYLRAARNGFETGFTSIYQARCHLPDTAT